MRRAPSHSHSSFAERLGGGGEGRESPSLLPRAEASAEVVAGEAIFQALAGVEDDHTLMHMAGVSPVLRSLARSGRGPRVGEDEEPQDAAGFGGPLAAAFGGATGACARAFHLQHWVTHVSMHVRASFPHDACTEPVGGLL